MYSICLSCEDPDYVLERFFEYFYLTCGLQEIVLHNKCKLPRRPSVSHIAACLPVIASTVGDALSASRTK